MNYQAMQRPGEILNVCYQDKQIWKDSILYNYKYIIF